MLRRLLVIASLLTPSSVLALDPARQLSQYDQRSWSLDEGLPQSSVLAIDQTPDGYLWLATLGGVVRFDGIEFQTQDTAHGVPTGWALTLAVDAQGSLWVVVNGELFRRRDDLFEAVWYLGAAVRHVQMLLPRTGGGMWVGRDESTLLWLDGDGAGGEVLDDQGQLLGNVRAGATDGSRACFAAAAVFCLDDEPAASAWVARRVDAVSAVIRSLAFDAEGTLWVGTAGAGIYTWRRGDVPEAPFGERRRLGLADGQTLALLADRAGTMWLGNAARGLGRISGRGRIDELPVGLVRSLFEDRAGNLWVGTNSAGLVRLTAGPAIVFSTPEGLPRPSVLCVIETDDGTLWLGIEGGGLVAIANGEVVGRYGPEQGLADLDVRSLAQDHDGRLLVGTAQGVFVGDADAGGMGRFARLATAERPVFALHRDRSGVLWGAFDDGLRRLGPAGFEPVEWGRGYSFYSIAETPDGTLWLGGDDGLLRLRSGQPEWIGDDEPGPSGPVLALASDPQGLWVGTLNVGLGRLASDGSYRRFGTAEGLCDDMVFSVLDDRAGRLWMSSNRGVFAVEKAAALTHLAAPEGEGATVPCRLLTRVDGLRAREANGGLQPSAWRGRDGRLWFATIDGVAGVDPQAVTPVPPPPVLFDRLEAGDQRIDGGRLVRTVSLTPTERDFAITYTALDLARPEALRFRYRLRGFKEQWVEAGERRTAYFTHLSPGQYAFEASVRVGDGPWSAPSRLPLELVPRFRETRLFALLVVAAALAALSLGYRWRLAGIHRRQAVLEQAVAARTADLEHARGALEQVNATLEARVEQGVAALRQHDRMAAYGRLVAGVVHELRHPIFSLRTVAHLLTTKLDQVAGIGTRLDPELDLLDSETARMKRLLDDLLELARPPSPALVSTDIRVLIDEVVASYQAAGASRDQAVLPVTLEIEESLPAIESEPEKLAQVLLNLLDNACRHARGATRVVLSASATVPTDAEAPWLRLTVADDGAGIALNLRAILFEPFVSGASGAGLGLAIARKTIEAHGGTIRLARAPTGPPDGAVGAAMVIELPPAAVVSATE